MTHPEIVQRSHSLDKQWLLGENSGQIKECTQKEMTLITEMEESASICNIPCLSGLVHKVLQKSGGDLQLSARDFCNNVGEELTNALAVYNGPP